MWQITFIIVGGEKLCPSHFCKLIVTFMTTDASIMGAMLKSDLHFLVLHFTRNGWLGQILLFNLFTVKTHLKNFVSL